MSDNFLAPCEVGDVLLIRGSKSGGMKAAVSGVGVDGDLIIVRPSSDSYAYLRFDAATRPNGCWRLSGTQITFTIEPKRGKK